MSQRTTYDLSTWTNVNPNVSLRVYEDGTVGIVRDGTGNPTCETIDPKGIMNRFPLGDDTSGGEVTAIRTALDSKFAPEPVLTPVETRYETLTVFVLEGVENHVWLGGDTKLWHTYASGYGRGTREGAEAAAREGLISEVRRKHAASTPPVPEYVSQTDDYTIYGNKGRAATVREHASGSWYWQSLNDGQKYGRGSREECEAAALAYVMAKS